MKLIVKALPFLVLSNLSFATAEGFCPINSQGKIQPSIGYEVSEIKTQGSKDTYILSPSKENPYGGANLVWTAHKDKQGRIIRIETGGEKPSQKMIDFENKKTEQSLKEKALAKKSLQKDFSLPSVDSFKDVLSKAEDFPVKFGRAIEMNYENGKCLVSKMAERVFDQKQKRSLDKIVFSADRCESIRNLHQKFKSDIVECSDKFKTHEHALASIFAEEPRVVMTSGVGGGGGAPMRSIASIDESNENPEPMAFTSFNGGLQKEKEMCDLMRPLKSDPSGESKRPASPPKSAGQQ